MPWTKMLAEQSNIEDAHKNMVGEGNRVISYQEAISEAIRQAMALDPDVVVMGEGVDAAGYIYDTTQNLSVIFGNRVIETPIAEAAMTGVAIGAAVCGKKPILIHMRNDFLLVSMDQIINHAGHWEKLFGTPVPLVIRAIIARGWGSGAQHSQSFQRLFAGFEGIDVYMPSTPYDVKGMFLNAVASKKPVIFLEHRWLYNDCGFVPEEAYTLPAGKAALRREGKDVTVVGMSLANRDIQKAIEKLALKGIDVEWIDLRCISPIDYDCLAASVKKTGRMVVVENGTVDFGIGAEIAAMLQEKSFSDLKAPIKRIGWCATTILAGEKLEAAAYMDVEALIETVEKVMMYD